METNNMIQIDQTLLQHLPFGLAQLNADNRITWVNDTLERMLGMRSDELQDRTLDELPDPARRLLATEPRLLAVDAGQHWISREIHSDGSGQRLLVVSDVSSQEQLAEENARLRQQVQDLKLTDDLTGLPNKRAISQALDLHISRSRRYQNPLSVVLVHIDLQKLDGVQPLSTDPLILALSRFLRDRLRWVDQIARWENNVFLLVLPETLEADARVLLDKIANEQDSMQLPEGVGELRPELSFGLACWTKGDDMRTLLRAALDNLQTSVGT